MKKLLSLIVLFLLSMSIINVTVFAQNTGQTNLVVYLDGRKVSADQNNIYIDECSRTMVRYDFFQQLLKVDSMYLDDWNPLCSASWSEGQGEVTIRYGGRTVRFILGEYRYFVDNVEYGMDTCVVKKGSSVYLPLRYAAEALGIAVEWNGAGQRIDLRSSTGQYRPVYWTAKGDCLNPLQVIKVRAVSDLSAQVSTGNVKSLQGQYDAAFFQKKALAIIPITNSAYAIKNKVTAVDVGAETVVVHISTLINSYSYDGDKSYHYVALEMEPWLLDKEFKVQRQVVAVNDYFPLGSAIKVAIKSLDELNDYGTLPNQAIMVNASGVTKNVSGIVYDNKFFEKQFILCIWFYDGRGGLEYGLDSIDAGGNTVNIVVSRKGEEIYTHAMTLSKMVLILDQDWAKKDLSVSILDHIKDSAG